MKKINQRNFSAKGARPTEYLPDQQKIQQFQNRPSTALPSKQNAIISHPLPPTVPIDVNKNFKIDNEKLSSEIIELKNRNNEIITENVKLKTKVTMSERDLKKYERIFEEVQNTGVIKGQQQAKVESGSNYLAQQLKKQLKDLKLELQFKEEQMEKMKKTVKVTKLQEIEIEKKQFADEAVRLKDYLEQVMQENMQVMIQQQNYSTLEEQYYQQYNNLNQNKQYTEQLKISLQEVERENNETLARIQKISTANEEMKKRINEKDLELSRLRNEYQQIVDSKQKILLNSFAQPTKLQQQKSKEIIKQNDDDNNVEQEKLKEKDKKINEMHQKISEIEQRFYGEQQQLNMKQQTNLAQLRKQEEDLKRELSKYQQENSKFNEQQQQQQQKEKEKEKEEEKVIITTTTEQDLKMDDVIQTTEEKDNKDEKEQEEMLNQAKDHIKHIFEEFKYKLIMNNIARNKIPEYLFVENKPQTDFPMLLSVLSNPPFNFESNDSSILSAYLIQGRFPLDFDQINGVKRKRQKIMETIDQVLKDYEIIGGEQQNQLIERYKSVFLEPSMKSNLQLISETNQPIVKSGGIEGILSVQPQHFTPTEIDFLLGKLLNSSKKHSITELLITDLIDFFQDLTQIQPLKAQRPHSAVQHHKQVRQQIVQEKFSSSSGSDEVVIVEEEFVEDDEKYKSNKIKAKEIEEEEVDEEIKEEESLEQSKGQFKESQEQQLQEKLTPVEDDQYDEKFDDEEIVEEEID